MYTFAAYASQELGIPFPSKGDITKANKVAMGLFETHAELDWIGLCGLVDWAKLNRKRFDDIFLLLEAHVEAYWDGYLSQIDPDTQDESVGLDLKIQAALQTEKDPIWRAKLLNTKGPGRKVVYAAWEKGIKLI
jgi:hypothetical protein